MKELALRLAKRKHDLIAHSDEQRARMVQYAHRLIHPMAKVDTGVQTLTRIRHAPKWLVGILLAVAIMKRQRLSALLQLGARILRSWPTIGPIVYTLIGGRR